MERVGFLAWCRRGRGRGGGRQERKRDGVDLQDWTVTIWWVGNLLERGRCHCKSCRF